MEAFLELRAGLEAKTIFDYLQPKIKQWWATEGPPGEVYFAQEHHPGHLCQSDFTLMEGFSIGFQDALWTDGITNSSGRWTSDSSCEDCGGSPPRKSTRRTCSSCSVTVNSAPRHPERQS